MTHRIHRAAMLSILLLLSTVTNAKSNLHIATPEETAQALRQNRQFLKSFQLKAHRSATWQPAVDTEDFGYVLMDYTDEGYKEVADLRRIIAQNLPMDVKLVILAPTDEAESIRAKYSQWISADRLIIAEDKDSYYTDNGFWARDSFPVPVKDMTSGSFHLVSADYFRPFEGARAITESVKTTMTKVDAVFVGGNLLADSDGQCFSVDSERLYDMTEDVLKSVYGCKKVKFMPHTSGIGDVDEVLKPLSGKRILTTENSYKSTLEGMGYTVIMLPKHEDSYRTYANSLIVGKTVFMPSFGEASDDKAAKVYSDLGYEVVKIRSNTLSDSLLGSIHCQTMAYPRIPEEQLFEALGVQKIQ